MTHYKEVREVSDEIRFDRVGRLGRVILARPQALNALTLDQVHALHPQLDRWAADPEVAAVVIEGEGDKAFCAGGDIRALALACGAGDVARAARFYHDEYRLNRRIKTFPKPYIALIDGIVMGGGVGVSVHGRYRVATERTVFAMPETGIGFFPDVGGSYFLPRCPGATGMYLALTGARLRAADTLAVGVATHVVAAARLDDARAALAGGEDAGVVLARFHADPGPAPITARRALIDRCFGQDSLDAILDALAAETDPWAAETLAVIRGKSPTLTLVTFEQIRRGARLDFDACMRMEYRLAVRVAPSPDFLEGVRAVIIDKDNRPAWGPVDPALLAAFDRVPDGGDLDFT